MSDSIGVLAFQTRRMGIAGSLTYIDEVVRPEMLDRDADIVVLPEKWITESFTEDSGDLESILSVFQEISEKYDCVVVPGSFSIHRDKGLFNSAPVIYRGRVLGWQDKISLFRSEKENYTRGKEARVFDAGSIRMAVSVCYDSDFPYYARMVAIRGSEIIVNPALIHSNFHDMWKIYVEARALENRIPFISVNSLSEPFNGNSILSVPEKYMFGAKLNTRIFGDSNAIYERFDLEGIKELREDRLGEDPGLYGFK